MYVCKIIFQKLAPPPTLALWMVCRFFPHQIVWISLSHSQSYSLFLPLSFYYCLSIYLFCSMQTLIFTQRNVFHKMKYDLKGHIYLSLSPSFFSLSLLLCLSLSSYHISVFALSLSLFPFYCISLNFLFLFFNKKKSTNLTFSFHSLLNNNS